MQDGGVQGGVRLLLRLEGAALLALSLAAYAHWCVPQGQGWGLWAACILLPDLALLAYLAGPRVGAACYNSTHSLLGAGACLGLALAGAGGYWLTAGLVWAAHIGFDRMLGYGLKYGSGFGHTHLGLIGRARTAPDQAG